MIKRERKMTKKRKKGKYIRNKG